jgi:hypothetical protein
MAPFRSPRGKPSNNTSPVFEPPPTRNPAVYPNPKKEIPPLKNPFKAVVLTKRGKVTPEGEKYYKGHIRSLRRQWTDAERQRKRIFSKARKPKAPQPAGKKRRMPR